MGESEMLQKPSSRKSSEFQQPPKVDENLRYVPKKALPEIVFSAKESPVMASALLEIMANIAKIHDDRVSKGVMSPVQLG